VTQQKPLTEPQRPTVFVSIGNTDNRLTQQQWSSFYTRVDWEIRHLGEDSGEYVIIRGRWVSPSTDPYQNACWAFTPYSDIWDGEDGVREYTRQTLQEIAGDYGQDSVAWAEATVEFLPGKPVPVAPEESTSE
jgi:hypothetical protein